MAFAASNTKQHIARILRRWDCIANQQLAATAAQLAAENEQLRTELHCADTAADSWRENAVALMQEACANGDRHPGITTGGALVAIPAANTQVAA